jgi:hypothetical protein
MISKVDAVSEEIGPLMKIQEHLIILRNVLSPHNRDFRLQSASADQGPHFHDFGPRFLKRLRNEAARTLGDRGFSLLVIE